MKYVIGIDLGTSGTKTVLFDLSGNAVASATREYPMLQERNGWAEQDPALWWQAARETLGEVLAKSGAPKEEIAGVGLSGQMHGLVMLDKDGKVLRNAILWCDQRTGEEAKELTALAGEKRLIEITANPAMTGFTAAKILWVRKHQPELYEKCAHILLPKDYLRYCLTGEFATEVSDASGMQLLDVPERCWSDEVLRKLQIPREWLGRVYESCEVTGHLLPEIAKATGLTADTVVVGGAGDNAAAAVGTGVVKDGTAFTTIGTSGVVFAHSSQVTIDPKGRVHTCCCAVPGAWHVMGVTQGAGLSLKWFKDQFCQDYVAAADEMRVDVYDLINHDIRNIPAGSDRLIYLPYLMGERTPHLDPDCRGVFFGLSAIHTKAHLLRAVMEGVSYSLADCNDILREMGVSVDEMMACGGGGKSAIWRQMLADLYGCPVKTVHQSEGPALGVAILAGVGCGIYESVEAACGKLVSADKCSEPNPENEKLYAEYHKLYKKLYIDLKNSYKELAAL